MLKFSPVAEQTRVFINIAKTYLMQHHRHCDGVSQTLARLNEQDLSQLNPNAPGPCRLSACRLLPDAVGAALSVAPELAMQIATLEEALCWQHNPGYSDEAMNQPGFMDNYAYAEIIGPEGVFAGDDFLLCLIFIGPGLDYRDHYHQAPELYLPLTGPHKWKSGANGTWQSKPAGMPIWHDPNEIHATETGQDVFLALTFWPENVNGKAQLLAS